MTDDALADLPNQRQAVFHILRLGFRFEPTLLWISFATTVAGAVPDALVALWLGLIAKGLATPRHPDRTLLLVAGSGMAFSCVGGWVLRNGSDRLHQRFRQRLGVALETHVARLQATTVGIEQHERPEVLDRLAMLRDQVFTLDHIFLSVFGIFGIAIRLVVVMGVLASVHPAMFLLGLAALPPVVVAAGVGRRVSAVWEGEAANRRLARHLFVLGTEAPSAKELRVGGAIHAVAADRAAAWDAFQTPVRRMRIRSGLAQTAAWSVFAAAFVATVAVVVRGSHDGSAALIVIAAGARLTAYIGLAATEINTWGFFVQGSQRLLWLEELVERRRRNADGAPPTRLADGITLDDVSFAYPGVNQPLVLEHVDLRLPAGSVVAVVGENGAGKSTLVKLLAKLYEPTGGASSSMGSTSQPSQHQPGASAWPAPSRTSFASSCRPRAPSVSATSRASTTSTRSPARSNAPVRSTSSSGSPMASRPNSGRPGPVGSTCPAVSGRSSPSPAGSCATIRCSSCSTNRHQP